MLVHDVAVLDDAALVEAATAAARLAVDNARLQADTRERVEELAASRRRIVEAADEQRRRIGRELRDEVFSRLDHVQALIAAVATSAADGPTAEALAGLDANVNDARLELDDLPRGIHPQALTDSGLAAALRARSSAAWGFQSHSTSPSKGCPRRSRRPCTFVLRRSTDKRRQTLRRVGGVDSDHGSEQISLRRDQRQRTRRRQPDAWVWSTRPRRPSRGIRRPPRRPQRTPRRHPPHCHDPDNH